MSEEREVIRREFPAHLETTGDGRTLEVRIVPYNTPTRVADPPDFVPYDEQFEAGAFDKQLNAANRVSVFVNVEHERGIKGVVGRGTELREVPGDGLHGTFRMLDHSDADKALQLVNAGDLIGVSAEFVPQKSVREDGVVKRLKARLVNIALVRPSGSDGGIQAYQGAQVLTVRETNGEGDEPEPAPDTPPEPEAKLDREQSDVDELLTRIGYEPLVSRVVVTTPWNDSPDRFDDEQFQRSCLLDKGGDAPVKERCSLPVLEPDGEINEHAIVKAEKRLMRERVSADQKSVAARKLIRYFARTELTPSASLRMMAAR